MGGRSLEEEERDMWGRDDGEQKDMSRTEGGRGMEGEAYLIASMLFISSSGS